MEGLGNLKTVPLILPYLRNVKKNYIYCPALKTVVMDQVQIPLYDILELDEKALTVRVEPMVTVGDVTRCFIQPGAYRDTRLLKERKRWFRRI